MAGYVIHLVVASEYLRKTKEVGKNIAIIGGGLTGCEIAYDLYLQGKKPTIIEMQNDLKVNQEVNQKIRIKIDVLD